MSAKIVVRDATADDAADIAQLFYDTIHHVNRQDYSPKQIAAWAPCVRPATAWADRQETRKTFVAAIDGRIVGFAELEPSGHIDCFYCHKDYQRCGVGSALMHAVTAAALKQRNQKMFAEVSITARPFFERAGFRLTKEQQVELRGVTMTNFVMEQELSD